MSDELTELQREWRNSVTASIKSTEAKMDLILEQLNIMRLEYVRQVQMDSLMQRVASLESDITKRVSGLENDRAKLVGAALILNCVGGIVIAIVLKLWK